MPNRRGIERQSKQAETAGVGRQRAVYQSPRIAAKLRLISAEQLPLPGFAAASAHGLNRIEREAIGELRAGPFGLTPHDIEGYADEAHRAYRRRMVPLDWIHHEQLARALGLVVLVDPSVQCAILDRLLVRLPRMSPRLTRFCAIHECAEHLLRGRHDATHSDVQALTIALGIERDNVSEAMRRYGARAVVELAARHRRSPRWEIRARVTLVEACRAWG